MSPPTIRRLGAVAVIGGLAMFAVASAQVVAGSMNYPRTASLLCTTFFFGLLGSWIIRKPLHAPEMSAVAWLSLAPIACAAWKCAGRFIDRVTDARAAGLDPRHVYAFAPEYRIDWIAFGLWKSTYLPSLAWGATAIVVAILLLAAARLALVRAASRTVLPLLAGLAGVVTLAMGVHATIFAARQGHPGPLLPAPWRVTSLVGGVLSTMSFLLAVRSLRRGAEAARGYEASVVDSTHARLADGSLVEVSTRALEGAVVTVRLQKTRDETFRNPARATAALLGSGSPMEVAWEHGHRGLSRGAAALTIAALALAPVMAAIAAGQKLYP